MPLDVRGFKADGLLVEADGETAYGAPVPVGFENLFGEARVSGYPPRGDVRGLDADGLEDLGMQRRREVGVDERVRDLLRQVLVGAQRRVDGFGKSGVVVVLQERAPVGVSLRCGGHLFGALDLPQAVVAKSPEGVLGVHARSVRAEVAKQRRQAAVGFREGREAWFAREAPSDGPQGEEGLVGGALVAGAPDLQVLELRKERFRARTFHGRMTRGHLRSVRGAPAERFTTQSTVQHG